MCGWYAARRASLQHDLSLARFPGPSSSRIPWPSSPRRVQPRGPMIETFRPLFDAAAGLDLRDPAAAISELERRLDPGGDAAKKVAGELRTLLAEGRIADRGAPPVRWSRVAKAGPETRELSIDVVLMDGAGPRHRHPGGEVNFCVALDGEPRFDGKEPGWVVFPPGSSHVPTVEGGTMLIVYLLPDGRIEFDR
jgi:hypothetical protein